MKTSMPSLFETVAIEPGAFRSASDVRTAVSSFGFTSGLLAAELPRSWFRQTVEALQSLSEVERASALRLLRRLQEEALVSVGFPYQDGRAWMENVEEAIRTGFVDHAVAGREGDGRFPSLLAFIEAIRPHPSRAFTMDMPGYESICRRLVEARPRIILIDPYFDVSREHHGLFLGELIKWRLVRGNCVVDIFARAGECVPRGAQPEAEFERRARAVLGRTIPVAPVGRTSEVSVTLLDDHLQGARMHDRFLFNDRGGITVGSGFRVDPVAPATIAGVLSKDDVSSLFGLFGEGHHGSVIRHHFTWRSAQR